MNDIFTSKSPTLDLHGETLATVDYLVKSFIKDNLIMKNKYIAIIHGWNSTILKKRVHELLKGDKKVLTFYIDYRNIGQTIVELDV